MESLKQRLSRDSWLKGALELCIKGVDTVKVAPLANKLGVTTGSFYWHFKNRRELLDEVLKFWEREMTDVPVRDSKKFAGDPLDRVHLMMERIVEEELARCDLAIWLWAQQDINASKCFKRAVKKRLTHAKWMFEQGGYSPIQAATRGRMLVTYMMGESTLLMEPAAKRRELLQVNYAILTAPE